MYRLSREIVGRNPEAVWQRHGKSKSANFLARDLVRLACLRQRSSHEKVDMLMHAESPE